MKKLLAATLTAAILAAGTAGCSSKPQETVPASAQAPAAGEETKKQEETGAPAKASGEKEIVEFWYHAADEKTNEIYEGLFEEFNNSQDLYEARYTGFANKDFP